MFSKIDIQLNAGLNFTSGSAEVLNFGLNFQSGSQKFSLNSGSGLNFGINRILLRASELDLLEITSPRKIMVK